MGVVRAFLGSRTLWTVMAFLLIWSLTRIGLRGLAKDPRFDARPEVLHAEGPAWGGPELLDPVLDRLEVLGRINLFDPRFEERIRGALLELPCVASVDSVAGIDKRVFLAPGMHQNDIDIAGFTQLDRLAGAHRDDVNLVATLLLERGQ